MLATMSWPLDMPPSTPPALIGEETLWRDLVPVRGTLLCDAIETGADLDTFHGIDAHQRMRDIGIETVEDRLAQARWYAGRHHVDARTD